MSSIRGICEQCGEVVINRCSLHPEAKIIQTNQEAENMEDLKSKLIGLTEHEAISTLKEMNLPYLIKARDGQNFITIMNLVDNRVNLYISGGVISRVEFG